MDEITDLESRKRNGTYMDETTNKRLCTGTEKGNMSTTSPRPKLSYDVIFLILLKLPKRSLARFKCVSKEFKAVITDPTFIALRPSLIIQAPCLSFRTIPGPLFKLFNIDFPKVEEIPLEMPEEMSRVTYLVGSCHGLLCFLSYKKDGDIYYLYNSLTKRWISAPRVQSDWKTFHAFYHKSSTNTYQLLTYVSGQSNSFNGYEVHELGTASWRAVSETNFPYVPLLCKTTPVAMFGCLYWICSSRKQHENRMILAFDVDNEKISYIKEPPGEVPPSYSSEALTLIKTDVGLGYPVFTPGTLDIWVMKGCNKAWEKGYLVNLEPIQGSMETSLSVPSYVVLIGTLGEIWFLDRRRHYEDGRSKLIIYDCNCCTFRSIDLCSLIPECYTGALNYSFCQWKSQISLNAF